MYKLTQYECVIFKYYCYNSYTFIKTRLLVGKIIPGVLSECQIVCA